MIPENLKLFSEKINPYSRRAHQRKWRKQAEKQLLSLPAASAT
jgi:hypothetical protein